MSRSRQPHARLPVVLFRIGRVRGRAGRHDAAAPERTAAGEDQRYAPVRRVPHRWLAPSRRRGRWQEADPAPVASLGCLDCLVSYQRHRYRRGIPNHSSIAGSLFLHAIFCLFRALPLFLNLHHKRNHPSSWLITKHFGLHFSIDFRYHCRFHLDLSGIENQPSQLNWSLPMSSLWPTIFAFPSKLIIFY